MNSPILDYRFWITLLTAIVFAKVFSLISDSFSSPLSLLVLPLAAIALIFLIIKPKACLVGILLTRPFLDTLLNQTKSGHDGPGIGAGINLAIILIALLIATTTQNRPKVYGLLKYWIIYLAVMFLTVLYSPFLFRGIRLYFNFVTYFSLFLLPFLLIKTKEDFKFWLKVLILSFIIPVIAADIDLIKGGHSFADAGQRIMGCFTHPNIFAYYLVLAFVVFLYALKTPHFKLTRNLKILIVLFMINILVLLVATKTRNAWIACMFCFLIYGALRDRKVLFILLLSIPVMLVIPPIQTRVLTVLSRDASEYKGINSMEWRIQMWKSSLSMIQQRPIQGYGLSSFKPLSEQFSNVGRDMGAHNAYLELLFESGIIGLLSFLAILFSPLLIFYKNMKSSKDRNSAQLWALCVGYLLSYIIICVADNLSYYLVFNWYVWLFISLMLLSREFQPSSQDNPSCNKSY